MFRAIGLIITYDRHHWFVPRVAWPAGCETPERNDSSDAERTWLENHFVQITLSCHRFVETLVDGHTSLRRSRERFLE